MILLVIHQRSTLMSQIVRREKVSLVSLSLQETEIQLGYAGPQIVLIVFCPSFSILFRFCRNVFYKSLIP